MSLARTDNDGRRRLRSGPVLVFVTAGLGLSVLLGAARIVDARRQLTFVRADLVEARKAVVGRQEDKAREALTDATERLAVARRISRGFPIGLVRSIPLLGSPARAIEGASDAGRAAVAAARTVLVASASFPTSGVAAVNGQNLKAFHDAATRSGSDLARAARYLDAARRHLSGPAGALLPLVSGPARAMLEQEDVSVRQIVAIQRGMTLLADLTGPRADVRLLLLAQDSLELRPTGGYIGSFGVLQFSGGTVRLERYQATEDLPEPQPPMVPPPELGPWLPSWWGLSNVNWSPDFPTTARTAKEMFRRQGGGEVDGVVAVTELLTVRLIGALGPLRLPSYADPVVAKGFERRAVFEVELKRPFDKPRKKFLIELADVLFQRLFTLPGGKLPGVTKAIDRSVGAGDLQVWFADPLWQKGVEATAWAGSMPAAKGDFLMLVDANLTASKANLGLVKEATYQVRRQRDGSLAAQLVVRVRNHGRRDSNLNPYYNALLRVYVPKGARLVRAGKGQRDAGDAPEGPYRVFAQRLLIDPGSEQSFVFDYRLPETVAPHGSYRLTWVRQAGTPRDSLDVVVDGHETEADPQDRTLDVEADLRDNRVVEFLRGRWVVRRLL